MSEKFNIFGKNHDVVGTADSDLILRFKGNCKLLIGNKFIDLFKDGKINVDVPDLIYKQDSVGTKDGIYVVGDKVILKVGDELITLLGEIGTTYVSFMGILDVSADLRHTALTNIGFLSSSLDNISLLNGIIYIENEKKLYTITGGVATEYQIDIPNPYTKQFVVAKTGDAYGAIVIQGKGKANSLAFDNMYIYSEYSDNYFESDGNIYFNIGSSTYLSITPSKTTVANTLESNQILSNSATSNIGFRLYMQGGYSTLEVDNLIVRNPSNSLYPEYYFFENNVIYSIQENETEYEYTITTLYSYEYKVDDRIYCFINFENDDEEYDIYKLPFIFIDEDKILLLYDELSEDTKKIVDSLDLEDILVNSTIFLVSGDSVPKVSKDGFEILDSNESVDARLGDLTLLGYDSNGLYSKIGVFESAEYKDSSLSDDDNSTKFASTEWVRKYVDSKIN